MNSLKPAIQVNQLSKIYSNGKVTTEVLNNFDLTINKGEFVSIMGPSGSGKSTLLYLIGGLETPTSGSVIVDKKKLSELRDTEISLLRSNKIGFVFQFYNLVAHLNVRDNIMLPALLSGAKKKDLKKKANELLELVGLREKALAFPSELSGGQQQRVSIARALIRDPEILLADEPIGNLDTKTGTNIMEVFKRINEEKGITIVQVTHSKESATFGNRIIHIRDGIIHLDSAEKQLAYA